MVNIADRDQTAGLEKADQGRTTWSQLQTHLPIAG